MPRFLGSVHVLPADHLPVRKLLQEGRPSREDNCFLKIQSGWLSNLAKAALAWKSDEAFEIVGTTSFLGCYYCWPQRTVVHQGSCCCLVASPSPSPASERNFSLGLQ